MCYLLSPQKSVTNMYDLKDPDLMRLYREEWGTEVVIFVHPRIEHS